MYTYVYLFIFIFTHDEQEKADEYVYASLPDKIYTDLSRIWWCFCQ